MESPEEVTDPRVPTAFATYVEPQSDGSGTWVSFDCRAGRIGVLLTPGWTDWLLGALEKWAVERPDQAKGDPASEAPPSRDNNVGTVRFITFRSQSDAVLLIIRTELEPALILILAPPALRRLLEQLRSAQAKMPSRRPGQRVQ